MPQTKESDGFGERWIGVGRSPTKPIHHSGQLIFSLTSCEVCKGRIQNWFQGFYTSDLPRVGGIGLWQEVAWDFNLFS